MGENTLEAMERCFNSALVNGGKFFAVRVETEGCPKAEVIVNPIENLEFKLAYYKKAYTDELVLKSYNGIRITNFDWGNNYEKLEKRLVY